MIQTIVLGILAFFVFFCYNFYSLLYAGTILIEFKSQIWFSVIITFINTVFLFICNFFEFPYVVTYFCGLFTLTCEFYFFSKSKLLQAYFGAAFFILNVICVQLLVVSTMALVLDVQIPDMIEVPDLFFYNIIITFTILLAALIVFKRNTVSDTMRIISTNQMQSILIVLLATFIICYSCIDTLLYTGYGDHVIRAKMLIAIQIMSLSLFYILIFYAVKIVNMSHYKSDMINLERNLKKMIQTNENLKRLIFKDNLTGCYSKSYLLEYLDEMLARQKVDFCLVYLDIDGLKHVNDTYGHGQGDTYLVNVTQCVARSIREGDTFARMSGDEFVLILEDCKEEFVDEILKRVQDNLKQMKGPGTPFSMALSYGIIYIDEQLNQTSRQELINMADKKMYLQKQAKKTILDKKVSEVLDS